MSIVSFSFVPNLLHWHPSESIVLFKIPLCSCLSFMRKFPVKQSLGSCVDAPEMPNSPCTCAPSHCWALVRLFVCTEMARRDLPGVHLQCLSPQLYSQYEHKEAKICALCCRQPTEVPSVPTVQLWAVLNIPVGLHFTQHEHNT